MNLFALSGLLTVMTGLPIAIFVYWAGSDKISNRLWALFVLSVSGYGWATYRIALLEDMGSALFWWRVSMFFVILIPVFFYHYTRFFLNIYNPKTLALVYLRCLFFLMLDFTPYFIHKVVRVFGLFYYNSDPTFFYTAFVFWFIFLVFVTHYQLWRFYKSASGEKKNQIAYFFLATAVGFGGGVTNFLPIYGFNFYPILNLAVSLYPIIMTYAIFRHQLFGIKVFATGLLTGVILLVLLFQIFFSQAPSELVLRSLFFIIVSIFGMLLIRSVLQEVRSREKIERLAKDLEEANEELKKLDMAKSEFISLAGHQLRAPMTAIKGCTSMLIEGSFGKVAERSKEALERIFTSTEILTKLTSELLDLSRIETGKMRYDFKPVNIAEIIQNILRELEMNAQNRGIALKFKNETKNNIRVFGDMDKIHEVIINLIDNAIKYSGEGKEVVIWLKNPANGTGRALVGVEDFGIGINPEEIGRLFGKFERTEESKKIRPDGMGLGLYFAKKIVEDHKGRIWAESKCQGKGSTFFVELPVA